MIKWNFALNFLLLILLGSGVGRAEDLRYLRIGTGTAGESHFPLGGLIASALSRPPGSPPCGHGGSCGLPGVIAQASATSGSVANLQALGEGQLDAVLSQADIAKEALLGGSVFRGHALGQLRAIANLGPDQMHVVCLKDSPIRTIADLKGKRISLGEKGSGTLVHARQVLAAWGLAESDLKAQYLRSSAAADAIEAGRLDAFFVMDGAPVPSVAELARHRPIRLLPLRAAQTQNSGFGTSLLMPAVIRGGTYEGIAVDVPTLAVGVSLIVTAKMPDTMAYAMTKALWEPDNLPQLTDGDPRIEKIRRSEATTSLGVALHPGALKYYQESHP